MMQNCTGREALFGRITELSFAMDDLRLFLDTHPDDTGALDAFTSRMDKRAELMDEYTRKYGGLSSYYPGRDGGWDWNASPMPWKKEANR